MPHSACKWWLRANTILIHAFWPCLSGLPGNDWALSACKWWLRANTLAGLPGNGWAIHMDTSLCKWWPRGNTCDAHNLQLAIPCCTSNVLLIYYCVQYKYIYVYIYITNRSPTWRSIVHNCLDVTQSCTWIGVDCASAWLWVKHHQGLVFFWCVTRSLN